MGFDEHEKKSLVNEKNWFEERAGRENEENVTRTRD